MRVRMTDSQKFVILERFGTEPEPYEWTEQDISVQIQNFLGCGEFVKSAQDNGFDHQAIPPGEEF
jgi:hypothetical protein